MLAEAARKMNVCGPKESSPLEKSNPQISCMSIEYRKKPFFISCCILPAHPILNASHRFSEGFNKPVVLQGIWFLASHNFQGFPRAENARYQFVE